jgi:DHA1 family bicyclomycin/chloramphenicol resistance-like MFS transporter
MTPTYMRHALILGLLAAIGPFAIDMYLPAMPSIAASLHTTTAATQMTITSFFMGFGLSQLVYGPLSDIFGRKPPLYLGLSLFILASIGCAISQSIQWLIFFRLIQGIGGASVSIIPRAIIRDLHTGVEATKLLSLVMLVFSVSPILAPVTGSALIVPFGWRAVFAAVTLAAIVGLIMTATVLEETHLPYYRVKGELKIILKGYSLLLRHPRFLGLTFIAALGISSFFVFLASSSFIYIDHYGLTPTQFSFAFSVNAIGFIGSSQFSAFLSKRFGLSRVISLAALIFVILAVALFAVVFSGIDNLAVLIGMLFLTFATLGLIIPTSMVLALDDHGPIAGMASALGGTLQMVTGGLLVIFVSWFFDGTALPMAASIALCAIGVFLLSRVTLPFPKKEQAA